MNRFPSYPLTLCSVVLAAMFAFVPFLMAEEAHKVYISNEGTLKNEILRINSGYYSSYEKVEFVFENSINLTKNIEEIKVPSGSSTEFAFTSNGGVKIDGKGFQGFIVSAGNSPISFENLQITNCVAQGLGGAIYIKSGDVSLLDVQFTNNQAVGGSGNVGAGGAVYVAPEASLVVQSTTFSNNQAQGGMVGTNPLNNDGLGNAIYVGGNITFDTTDTNITLGSTQSLGGPAGTTTNFSNYTEEAIAELKKNAGEVYVVGGGTLILQSENTHLGKTEVDASTLVLQNSKAIHGQAEISLINGGILELTQTHTSIGYLSGTANSEVHIGGITLTIGGDEYAFGTPGNGKTVLGDEIMAFDGKIVTNLGSSLQNWLVKSGTGLLILGGDNTNTYDFCTEIHGGTIQLNNEKGLGGGRLVVTSTDTEARRNMLQTGLESLTLENDIQIDTKTPFRIGVADDLASNNDVVLDLAGQITAGQIAGGPNTGGAIMMNMGNKAQVLTLSNSANQLSQVQLNVGTLAVTGEQTGTKWTTGLGGATIVALLGSGDQTALRIDTQGLIVDNNITIHSSGLAITNGEDVTDFTLAGKISGSGSLMIDLNHTSDTIHFGGQLINTGGAAYEGITDLQKGTLQFDPTSKMIQFAGGLALSQNAVLDLNGNSVSFNDKGVHDLNGTIIGTGSLVKSGTGTWNLNLQNTMNNLTVDAGTVNLKNDSSVDNVTIGKNGTLKLDVDAQLRSLSGSTGAKLNVNDKTLTLAGTGEAYYGELLGGSGSTIILENGRPEGKSFDWQLYGTSLSWAGTINVQEGANLRVSSTGALGRYLNNDAPRDVASVILNNSTLSINTYDFQNGPARLGRLEINGLGIIDAMTNMDQLYLYNLEGTGDLIKTGQGALFLIGENSQFEGDVLLESGAIFLHVNAGIGTGKLISGGAGEDLRGLLIYADENASSRELSNDMSLGQDLTINYGGVPELILSGKIDGEKRLNIQTNAGSGKIVLTGNYDDYSGLLFINYGTTLQLGHIAGTGSVDLLHSTVSVASGATFNASGTVNNLQVAGGGKVELTSATARLHITDQLTIASGAILSIDCTGTTGGGLITIDGTDARAVLNGGIVWINASNIQIGDTFTLIDTVNDGLLEVNKGFSFRDNVNGARVVGTYDVENQRYTYKFVAFDYLESMKTKNQRNLGNYLNYLADHAILTPEESLAFGDLESIIAESPELGQLLVDELSGQVYASMGTAQVQGTSLLNQSLATQLRPGAFAGSAWDGTGRSYRGQAFADRGLSAWLTGYGMIGTIDPDGNATGYDLDIYGGLLGLERCSNNLSRRLGFYYGYGQTKLDTKSTLGKSTSDDNRLGLYLKWDDRFGYGLMSGGVGFNSYKFDRSVWGEGRRQNVSGVQSSFYGERGASLRSRLGVLQPFVGIQYIYQHQNGFEEDNDNLFALNSNGVFTNSLRTMVGGRFIKAAWRGQQSVQWYLQGHWMHEYLDQNATMTAAFAPAGPGFEVSGNSLGRDWLVAGTGIQWNFNARTSITGSYDAQFNDRTMLHVGSIGTKIVW